MQSLICEACGLESFNVNVSSIGGYDTPTQLVVLAVCDNCGQEHNIDAENAAEICYGTPR